jgi:pSer/pThr/pTyr-binding forkhead associated (FHA) protein
MSEVKLRVHDAHGKRLIALDRPLFTIGRKSTANLNLRPADVSREHAEIAWLGDHYVLRDVGSSQGTYVNGRRVLTHSLADGDRIRLGQNDVEIVFEEKTTSISDLMDTTSDVRNLGQMAAILNGLRALGSGRVLAEVLAVVLDAALDVTKAERGFIMLANERESWSSRPHGCGPPHTARLVVCHESADSREVFSTDRAQLLTDLTEDAARHDDTRAVGIRHVMCVPLRVASRLAEASSESAHRVLGVLYLDGQERSRMRSSAVLSALEAFATRPRSRSKAPVFTQRRRRRRASIGICVSPQKSNGRCLGRRRSAASASSWRPSRSRAERSAAISMTIWNWAMAAWRSPWATSPERARRRRSWRRWFRATSLHRPQSAPTRDRPPPASTPRCCVARSRHALPRCSTGCSPRMDV